LVAKDDEGFDPRSIPLQRWDDYALANNLPGRRGVVPEEKAGVMYYQDANNGYEMDDIHSMYSSVKPASTILTGFPGHQQQGGMQGMYRPPQQSPSPFNAMHRQSTYSRYTDAPQQQQMEQQQRLMSMGGMSDQYQGLRSPPLYQEGPGRTRSPLGQQQYGGSQSRPVSTNNLTTLSGFQTQGPSNEVVTQAIRECLGEVDMDSVTKKQVKALVEQKLQCQLQGDKRAFLDSQIDFELANM